jgi:hypothetical protein
MFSRSGRRLLGLAVFSFFVAGCGGTKNVVSGAVPQNAGPIAQSPAHGKSWMKPGTSGSDLLYIGSPATGDIYVYTYPGGELVGMLTGLEDPLGLCSDTNGNVWITNVYGDYSYLVAYAHGGTKPIATLEDSGFAPQACSVDPTTGNLAVANQLDDVAVWRHARGKRRLYLTSYVVNGPETIAYDGSGDAIFADWKTQNGWLPKGHSKAMTFGLQPQPRRHGPFLWDGKHLGILVFSRKLRQEDVIQYNVSGGIASKVGAVPLNGVTGVTTSGQFWIQDSGIVLTDSRAGDAYFFDYPQGGNPTNTISGLDDPYGVTVSIVPSQSRSKVRGHKP